MLEEPDDRHLYVYADVRCPYCLTWFEAGASCGSASRASECPHMDDCDRDELRRELDAEFDDRED